MRKIYIITAGEYSDYGIEAVFFNKKEAEVFQSKFTGSGYGDELMIEEWPISDGIMTKVKDKGVFRIHMDKEGSVTEKDNRTNEIFCVKNAMNRRVWFDVEKKICMDVFARDLKHAIKIVNEKRTQFIANNEWGKDKE